MNTTIKVNGMSCSHCENAVKSAAIKIDGVSSVLVDLKSGNVEITHNETVSIANVKEAIEEQGYDVE
jgi:copper chaperone